MWLSLILTVLIIVITIRQASQGWFSAFLMTALTICCAAAALGTYEWVANQWLAQFWKPSYALPIALGVTFGIPLLALRLVFDRLVRRACLLPAWADRIGGGVCGSITALTMVGVLAISLAMLPFDDGSLLGYARFDVLSDPNLAAADATVPAPDDEGRDLWLNPDRFVVAVASILSHGVFSSGQTFYEHNPRLAQAIGWMGATDPEVSRYAPPGSISVAGTETVEFLYRFTPGNERRDEPPIYEPHPPPGGHEFRMIRVQLSDRARDERKSHVFTLRQFRLVGQAEGNDTVRQYHPIAIQQEDADDAMNRHIRTVKSGRGFSPVVDRIYEPRDNSNRVEVVFELPSGFRPSFLEYKREARARVSFTEEDKTSSEVGTSAPPREAPAVSPADADRGQSSTAPTRPSRRRRSSPRNRGGPKDGADDGGSGAGGPTASSAPDSRPAPPSAAPRRRRGGNVRAATVNAGRSHFGDDMPITLKSYRRLKNANIENGRFVGGHLAGVVAEQDGGPHPAVSKFEVPQNKRLLQLSTRPLQSRSTLGRALSQTVTTLQNYFVEDARGNRHLLVGKYAIANVGGRQVIEVQYFSERVGSVGSLGKFDGIDEKKLKPSDEYVLLFLVDPGARIVAFSTGGAATRKDDLRAENLVAPS